MLGPLEGDGLPLNDVERLMYELERALDECALGERNELPDEREEDRTDDDLDECELELCLLGGIFTS